MGDFKDWYSTFLTDLPGGGVPLHKRRKGAADGREAEQVRVGTPDYRSLVRDIHRVESLQRNKMRSLPELTRSPSPTGRASRAGGAQSTMSSTSLPMLLETTDASRPSVGKCQTFLKTVLHCEANFRHFAPGDSRGDLLWRRGHLGKEPIVTLS